VVLLMQTGMGPQKAHQIATRLLQDDKWDLVVSTGFAGALQDLPIGTLVIGDEWLDDPLEVSAGKPAVCDSKWVARLVEVSRASLPFSVGRFVSVSCVLTQSEQKQKMASLTGATAVDMESGSIARVAKEFGVPFVIIRTISDGWREDLPLDFNNFQTLAGWLKGLCQCLISPKAWKGLFRLYRQSRVAGAQLTKFFKLFFPRVLALPSYSDLARTIS